MTDWVLSTTIFYDYFLLLLMFNKFWKMKEGFAFGAGLIVVGLALQFSVGPIHWSDFAFPLNGIFLFLFLCSLGLVYVLRHKVRFFGFFHRVEAAVPILLYAAALTVVMGLTRQVPAHERAVDPIGLTQNVVVLALCAHLSHAGGDCGIDSFASSFSFSLARIALSALPRWVVCRHRVGNIGKC